MSAVRPGPEPDVLDERLRDRTKVAMNPRASLNWIRLGVLNQNYGAVLEVIDDVLAQLPEDAEFAAGAPEEDAPPTLAELDQAVRDLFDRAEGGDEAFRRLRMEVADLSAEVDLMRGELAVYSKVSSEVSKVLRRAPLRIKDRKPYVFETHFGSIDPLLVGEVREVVSDSLDATRGAEARQESPDTPTHQPPAPARGPAHDPGDGPHARTYRCECDACREHAVRGPDGPVTAEMVDAAKLAWQASPIPRRRWDPFMIDHLNTALAAAPPAALRLMRDDLVHIANHAGFVVNRQTLGWIRRGLSALNVSGQPPRVVIEHEDLAAARGIANHGLQRRRPSDLPPIQETPDGQ